MRLALTTITILMAVLFPGTAQANQPAPIHCKIYASLFPHTKVEHYESCMWWRVRHIGTHYRHLAHPTVKQTKFIICSYWKTPAGCRAAWIVAWKESSFYWGSTNGQYCSVYQMGDSERTNYGANPCHHGGNNIRGAFRYWCGGKVHGRCQTRSWGPWQCKPYPGDGCKSVPSWVTSRP